MMIVGLGKITDDSMYKYHQYESWAGIVIVILRLGLFAYFLVGIQQTIKKARIKIKLFIQKLAIIGSCYFLAFPLILFIALFLAPYLRYKLVTFGTFFI